MKSVKQIWFLSLLIKIVAATLLPLSHDEAYYWVWSNNLQLSYYDHPAMVSWIFWLGHFLEPLGNAVRLPAVLLGHVTLLFWLSLLQKYCDLERAKAWLLIALACPLIGFGSLIVTPDLPLLFFWSAAIFYFLRFLEDQKTINCCLLGASLGLGFCSKYHIVLFVPIALAYLQFEKKWALIGFKKLIAVILVGLVFSMPVLLWNYSTDFASFRFQLAHGLERPNYKLEWTLGYAVGQIMLLFPLIFWKALKARLSGSSRFLIYAGWGPLLFFFVTSFRALVEANWPIAAYPAIFFLAVTLVDFNTIARRTYIGWVALYLLIGGILLIPNLEITERLKEPTQFRSLVPLLSEYQPLYASTYQMASSLWYATKKPVYKLQFMNRHDFYDTLSLSRPDVDIFYVVKFTEDYLPEWVYKGPWMVKEIKKIDSQFVLVEVKRI